jgi:acetylornithine/succinyldiaminopimelate/putrescine aminotransferase
MMDEVQTGFARTGQWFGFEHAGIKPDVVTLAKAMGNGMPIGAVWARKEIASVFQPGDHGSTFSGTAIATAAARATIKVMLEMDAPAQAKAKGKMLSDALSKLPQVVEIRGRGLLLGVELQSGIDAKLAQSMLLDRGLVTNAVTASALRLAPPITVLDSEIATAVLLITSVLAEIASKS